MKKSFIFTFMVLSIFSHMIAGAELSLSASSIKSYTSQGYILSDSVKSYTECSNMVKRYNTEYPSYTRSQCFKDADGYKYFICQANQDCTFDDSTSTSSSLTNTNQTTQQTNTNTQNIAAKDKLDGFVSKVKAAKSNMSEEKYAEFLDNLIAKLSKMQTKYATNKTIAPMITYLKQSLEQIKSEITISTDIDNFFCELTDSCSQSSTGSVQSGSDSTASTKTGTTSQTTQDEILSLYVTGGILACGNPDKNNYTTYSPVSGVAKIQKGYCNDKGGYVWTVCGGKQSNIKLLSNVKNNDTFVCNSTQSNLGGIIGSISNGNTSTISGSINSSLINSDTSVVRVKPTLSLLSFDKQNNILKFSVGEFTKYNTIMLQNDTVGRMVLQCYYLEKNANTSPHCIAASKISGDYESAVYEVKLTQFAIENGVKRNSMLAFVDGLPESDIVKILSSSDTQSILPKFSNTRSSDDKGQYHSWSTQNVDRLSWKCIVGNKTFSDENAKVNHDMYYTTWEQFHQNGWEAGTYICNWLFSGNGTTGEFKETFTLK